MDLRLTTAVQGREHGPKAKGAGGQHEVLHTRIDRGAGLQSAWPEAGMFTQATISTGAAASG